MRLVIVGGFTVEATRELKSVSRIDVCVETMRNALRDTYLGSVGKISKLVLFAKNVKERLEFAKMYKDWTIHD